MSEPSQHPDVVIVGAGAAGLAAAQRLTLAGRNVLMLEARERIGGRVHTVCEPPATLPIELGAEFIHGRPAEVWPLIATAGLPICDAEGEHWHFRNGRLTKITDYWERIANVLRPLAAVGPEDCSYAHFAAHHRYDPALHEFNQELGKAFVEGFYAAPADRVSARSLAASEQDAQAIAGNQASRILTGYSHLLQMIVGGADPARLRLHLPRIVTAVHWKDGAISLESESPEGSPLPPVVARHCLITVPVGVLRAVAGQRGAIRFNPLLPDWKLRAIDQLEMGPVVKVVMRFREPFWEEGVPTTGGASLRSMAFLLSRNAAFPTWWCCYPLRTTVLVAWSGGPAAARLTGRPDNEILTAARQTLAEITGLAEDAIASQLQSAHVADWPADPFARGAYAYSTVGGENAGQELARPVGDTIFFAGEATHAGMSGTVAGAIATGHRAAREIIAGANV